MKPLLKAQSASLASWLFGSLLLFFLTLVFLFAPATLPEFKQRLLGIFAALLSGCFAYSLTGKIGVEFLFPQSRFGQMTVKATGGLAVFVFVLWWWWFSASTPIAVETTLKKTAEIENYTKGGAYPQISVELYFGPREGMEHTFVTDPPNPGFILVSVENTNDFPIYDLQVAMLDLTKDANLETAKRFNDGQVFGSMKTIPTFHPNQVLTQMLPANTRCRELAFDFATTTRSGSASQSFRFQIVSNRWEYVRRVFDNKLSKTVSSEISSNYPGNLADEEIWKVSSR